MRLRGRHAIWLSAVLLVWAAAAIAGGVILRSLYIEHLGAEQDRLLETAQSWARLVEAIVEQDPAIVPDGVFEEAYASTVSQIREAHAGFQGFGESGEFTFARLADDQIVFLLSHRYLDLDDPEPVPMSAARAEPMRRALTGGSGTIVGLDYRRQTVLAAFEPVRVPGYTLGIVAKIDLVEVRRPFMRAAVLGLATALLLLLLAMLSLGRIVGPFVRELAVSRFIVEHNPDPIYWVRRDSSIIHANSAASRQLGYTVEELTSMEVQQIAPDSPKDAWVEHWDEMKTAGFSRLESHHRTKDGRVFPVDIVTQILTFEGEEFLSAYVCDTSERQAAEALRRRSEVELRLITDKVPAFIAYVSTDFRYRFVNRRYQELFGVEESEIIGRKVVDLLGKEPYATVHACLERARAGETVVSEAEVPMAFHGEKRFLSSTFVPDIDPSGEVVGIFCLIIDLTDRKEIETELVRALEDKNVLLKEVHHRVKNNLQVISSLLYLQATRASDDRVSRLFLESRDRVHAMALAHNVLYETEDLVRIDLNDYLGRVSAALVLAYLGSATQGDVDIEVDCEPVDIHRAIQCGLIVNELLTNALKYAYPRGGPRPVLLSFAGGPGVGYRLEVRDRGVGLPPGLDVRGETTLGLRLVHLLAEQMNATVEVEVAGGTRVIVHIPPDATAPPA